MSEQSTVKAALSLEKVTIVRGRKKLYADFSLAIAPRVVTVLIAPSGSGKTTLLSWIAGVLDPRTASVSGSLLFSGSVVRPRISFLFQEPRLIPGLTVMQNVMLPLVNTMERIQAAERASFFLERVSLSEKMDAHPDELSGGERQRAAAARAFAYPADILLMDEPFQSQDLRIKIRLIETLETLLAEEKRTVLFVTHDVDEAVRLSERLIVMDGTPLSVIFDEETAGADRENLARTVRSLVVNNGIIDYNVKIPSGAGRVP